MTVLVTSGPSYESIDEVRRITNASTGELGVLLANRLGAEGFKVFCLCGVGSTYRAPVTRASPLPFTTNQDLFEQLARLQQPHHIVAVFHAAALCDFQVRQVTDLTGADRTAAK